MNRLRAPIHLCLITGLLIHAVSGRSHDRTSNALPHFQLHCQQPQSIRDFKDILMWQNRNSEKEAACYCGPEARKAGTNVPPVPVPNFIVDEPSLSKSAQEKLDKCTGSSSASFVDAHSSIKPASKPKRHSEKQIDELKSKITFALEKIRGIPDEIGALADSYFGMAELYEHYPKQHGYLDSSGHLVGKPSLDFPSGGGGLALKVALFEAGLKKSLDCLAQSKQGDHYMVPDECFLGIGVEGNIYSRFHSFVSEFDLLNRGINDEKGLALYLTGLPNDHLKDSEAPCSNDKLGCAQHLANAVDGLRRKWRPLSDKLSAADVAIKNWSTTR